MARNVCPECSQGKCRNCDGTAWHDERDEVVVCDCYDAEHEEPKPGRIPAASTPSSPETTHTEVRTLMHVEYGVRDLGGDIVSEPAWKSPADLLIALARHGYVIDPADVLTRTTTTTVTTTGWEAAR